MVMPRVAHTDCIRESKFRVEFLIINHKGTRWWIERMHNEFMNNACGDVECPKTWELGFRNWQGFRAWIEFSVPKQLLCSHAPSPSRVYMTSYASSSHCHAVICRYMCVSF